MNSGPDSVQIPQQTCSIVITDVYYMLLCWTEGNQLLIYNLMIPALQWQTWNESIQKYLKYEAMSVEFK